MGTLRGLYRPTPRGTVVIRLDARPSHKCLYLPASPPTAGARRLVGPADLPGMEPTALVHRGRVLPAADHCSHYLSCLINGAWGPWEGPADFWWPTPIRADWWCFRRLSYARRLVGAIIPGSYQQAVVGTGLRPLGLMSGPAWQ